jgi:hypothetical protein
MVKVELYGRVRRAVPVEGRSERVVALKFGMSRETVRKRLRYAVPPGYQRQQPVKRPKLGRGWGRDRRDSDKRFDEREAQHIRPEPAVQCFLIGLQNVLAQAKAGVKKNLIVFVGSIKILYQAH